MEVHPPLNNPLIAKLLDEPKKGKSDKKDYRALELANGLCVVLVSDSRFGEPSKAADFEGPDLDNEASDPEDDDDEEEGDDEEEDLDEEEEEDDDEEEDGEDEDGGATEEGAEKKAPSASKDAFAYKAGAALVVGFGSAEDPPELPGLMHFLEHMVFMGSEKYPKENSFDDFISRHGGCDNAYTDTMHTNFHFDVHEGYIWEALDRFSQFFVSPLMKKNAMERERNAVDSEFTMALPSDCNREQQLLNVVMIPDHPLNQFCWGNAASLSQQPDDVVYEKLHKYRKKYYSAQFMTVAVQSRHSLDVMQEKVVEIFSKVPNNGIVIPVENYPFPFPTSQVNKVIKMEPLKANHLVSVTWFLPPMIHLYKKQPLRLLTHLVGHEGYGSLLSFYKTRNWALGLDVNSEIGDQDNNRYCCQMSVSIELTEDGFSHVEDVLFALFQYMALLRHNPPDLELYRDYHELAELSVDYMVDEHSIDYAQSLAENLQKYGARDCIGATTLLYEFDKKLTDETIAHLTWNTANIIIRSRLLGDFTGDNVQTEKWFGTKYTIEDISPEWRTLFASAESTPNPALHMPAPNQFIPKDFSLLPPPALEDDPALEHPKMIVQDGSKGSLYYKPDHQFKLPFSYMTIHLIIEDKPKTMDIKFKSTVSLMLQCLRYQCVEAVYPATLARYSYHISSIADGFIIVTHGFTSKIDHVLLEMMDALLNFKANFKEEHFNILKDLEIRQLYASSSKPTALRNEMRLKILAKPSEMSLERLEMTKQITAEDVLACCDDLLTNAKLVMLVQGTIKEEDAITVYKKMQDFIPRDSSPSADIKLIKSPGYRIQRDGVTVVRLNTTNMSNGNSAIANYYQGEPGTIRSSLLLDFVSCEIQEHCFDTLRTKEQLGYSVSFRPNESSGVLGMTMCITPQASKFSLSHVDSRIEAFLSKFDEYFANLSDEKFATLCETVRNMKSTHDICLKEQFGRNWSEIVEEEFQFDRLKKQMKEITTITKEEVLEFYRSLVSPTRPGYRKLSVQVVGSADHASHKPPSVDYLTSKGMSILEYLPQEPDEGTIPAKCPTQATFIKDLDFISELKEMPHHPIV